MIPAFRETVEDCFNEGLLKVVFATETLALGINMPARAVVIERLSKYNGEGHEFLTPGQFTQLTGRAGRRGLDAAGSAVVLWSPFSTFDQVATLAASREFPLSSSFRPTYNMTANLVHRYDRETAHEVLSRSFAQFQADRAVVRLRARRDRLAADLAAVSGEVAPSSSDDTTAQVFDVAGYARAQQDLRDARRAAKGSRRDVEQSLARLRPGDVIERGGPSQRQLLVVLAVSQRRGARPRSAPRAPPAVRSAWICPTCRNRWSRSPMSSSRYRTSRATPPTGAKRPRCCVGSIGSGSVDRSTSVIAPTRSVQPAMRSRPTRCTSIPIASSCWPGTATSPGSATNCHGWIGTWLVGDRGWSASSTTSSRC